MSELNFKRLDGNNWYMAVKLPDEVISYLWDQVAIAEKNNIDHRPELAGNISRSLTMTDPDNVMIDKVFNNIFNTDLRQIFIDHVEKSFRVVYPRRVSFGKPADPKLEMFWVNFQKKYEFNPLHNHSGHFSFVIWMKIPYDLEKERELSWVKGSNVIDAVGNFMFVDSNMQHHIFDMYKELEGYMCIFPSDFYHMVYPFYTSDEERVSISGNIFFELQQ